MSAAPVDAAAVHLDAVDELLGDVQFRLLDAEELMQSATRARAHHAERISRAGAEVCRQLAALAAARQLLAERAAVTDGLAARHAEDGERR